MVAGEGAQGEIRPRDSPQKAGVGFGVAALSRGFDAQAMPGGGQVRIDTDSPAIELPGAHQVSNLKRLLGLDSEDDGGRRVRGRLARRPWLGFHLLECAH
jgi:hypothetical protein